MAASLVKRPAVAPLIFGWGALAVLHFLNSTGMAQISEWVGLGVGSAVGLGFYWEDRAKQKEMRADLERLLSR